MLASPPARRPSSAPLYLATLLALLALTGRDLGASPLAALGLLGGTTLALLPLLALDELVARVPLGRLGVAAARRLATAAILLPLLVAAAFRAPAWGTAAVALVFALLAVLIEKLPRRLSLPETARGWIAVAVTGLLLDALFVVVHRAEATLVDVRPATRMLHYALGGGTLAATVALAFLAGTRGVLWALPPSPRWLRWGKGVAAGLAGIGAVEADRRLFVGLYPGVHAWLGAVGFVALDAALRQAVPLPAEGGADTGAARRGRWAGVAALALPLATVAGVALAWRPLGRAPVRAGIARAAIGWLPLSIIAQEPMTRVASEAGLRAVDHPRFHDVPEPAHPPYNVLLISIDALRADALGTWDAPSPGAPRLAALAKDSLWFQRAYAQGPRTAMGMGALFLGTYSANSTWVIRGYSGGKLVRRGKGKTNTAVVEVPPGASLGERMRAAGLRTVGIPFSGANRFFSTGTGFERGFASYQDLSGEAWTHRTAAYQTELALEALSEAPRDPWFLWIHYFDPHEAKNKLDYPRKVAITDRAVGRLLDGLAARGLRGRTVIAVVADHGEAQGEHRHFHHGTSLYEEQVRVPLVLHVPGIAGREVADPVAAIDATATLLTLAGASTRGVDGVNLMPLVREGRTLEHRPVFTELHRYRSVGGERTDDLKAVVQDGWKLILDRRRGTAQLFDLGADPGELHDRILEQGERYAAMRAVLDAFLVRGEAKHPLP